MQQKIIHKRLTIILQGILAIGAGLAFWEQQWLTASTTVAIILITMTPFVMGKRFQVFIPPEFECLATVFVFGSLFLGEVRGYYLRFWWWDLALHTASGVLLGIVGFLLVYVLNEKEEIQIHMAPGFVALFAFLFGMGIGTLWEIFEYSMDQFFGMTMQKPMWDDPSGLTDTMWDMIVDSLGAAVIAVMGYGYLKTAGKKSFLEQWIAAFIQANPRIFQKGR
ncbi:MAG: hypothetical protein ACSLFH_07685 [Desulfuromonadales bacterium]